MTIKEWLSKFVKFWENKDVDKVRSLFSENFEYWETPFKKLEIEEFDNEWSVINRQENLQITTEVVCSEAQTHTVMWGLQYDSSGSTYNWKGLYLIKLDDNTGLCSYFYQVGERGE